MRREPTWFKQVWFAGNHSDIGGSYAENESRLSDISLKWMVEEAQSIPNGIIVDNRFLNLSPDSLGGQHDECKSGILATRPDCEPLFWNARQISDLLLMVTV